MIRVGVLAVALAGCVARGPVSGDVEVAIRHVEEDIRIHRRWADTLRADPDGDFGHVGDVAHHEKWIRRYQRVLRILRAYAARSL